MMAALTRWSRQQLPAATAATVSPPSEWPATATRTGLIRPARALRDWRLAASTRRMT
jgi:hypothetical protein